MTVHEAIENAEAILPGVAAPEGQEDPRWQAIIAVAGFIEDEPELVWTFVERWGQYPDEDLRAAIATCLLEHLLEAAFRDPLSPRRAFGSVESVLRRRRWNVLEVWKHAAAGECCPNERTGEQTARYSRDVTHRGLLAPGYSNP